MAVARSQREASVDLVTRFFEEVWHDGDLDALDELCAPDFEITGIPSAGETSGGEGHRAFIAMMREAFPGVRYEYDPDEMIVDENGVACYFVATGAHEGELMGIEPTGRDAETRGILMARVDDGVMTSARAVWDELGMLRQLGVVPADR